MAGHALGIFQHGKKLGIAIVQHTYRQKTMKFSQTITLQSEPQDVEAVKSEVNTLLQSIVAQEKIKKARVSFGVDSSYVMWNTIEMPPVSREDLRQIVQFEMESHVPVDPDNCMFDIQVFETIEGLTNKVALFTVHKNVVDMIRETASEASMLLDSVTPVDTALARLCRSQTNNENNEKIQVILCAKDSGKEIVLSRNGRFFAHRTVSNENPWSSETSTETSEFGTSDDDDTSFNLLEQNIQIALMMSNESPDQIEDIVCVGNVSDTELRELAAAMPNVEIHRLWVDDHVVPGTHYCQAAATALAFDLLDSSESVNFLPESFRPVRRDMGRILIGVAAGLLVASMVIVGANNYWLTDLKLLETEARLASIEHQVSLITDVNRKLSQSQETRNYFASKNLNYPTHLEVLLEATRLLPDTDTDTVKMVWLEQMDIDNREVNFRGDSDSPEGIITILDDSPYFERVRFDGTVTGTRFTIKANISRLTHGFEELDESYLGPDNGEFDETERPSTEPDDTESAPPEIPESEQPHENQLPPESHSSEFEEPEISRPRGPAFPRFREEEPLDEEPENESDESMFPPDQEDFEDDLTEEEMQEMRKRLIDYIQERREMGDYDTGYDYREIDNEESATNFLEFLTNLSETEYEGESEWQE
jgi:hypothetical protein